jgi:hypothetical protein
MPMKQFSRVENLARGAGILMRLEVRSLAHQLGREASSNDHILP